MRVVPSTRSTAMSTSKAGRRRSPRRCRAWGRCPSRPRRSPPPRSWRPSRARGAWRPRPPGRPPPCRRNPSCAGRGHGGRLGDPDELGGRVAVGASRTSRASTCAPPGRDGAVWVAHDLFSPPRGRVQAASALTTVAPPARVCAASGSQAWRRRSTPVGARARFCPVPGWPRGMEGAVGGSHGHRPGATATPRCHWPARWPARTRGCGR